MHGAFSLGQEFILIMENALLKNTSQVDCQQLIDAVKADVKVFANGAEQSDDITLLAIKRH